MAGNERLQKIIAAAGVTSRRKAEQLILDGRVAVNGEVATELGVSADPDHDLVTLDGAPLARQPLRYFLVNKPAGVLSAVSDDRGRRVVVDLLGGRVGERLYPAGRLDLDSEGLVLLTNDGSLMQAVTRPGGAIEKVYEVSVRGRPRDPDLDRLRRGAMLGDRQLLACRIEALEVPGADPRSSCWRVTLNEGKKNQIRRMFDGVGHPVVRLVRVAIGPLALGDLAPGAARELSRQEVEVLRAAAARPNGAAGRST